MPKYSKEENAKWIKDRDILDRGIEDAFVHFIDVINETVGTPLWKPVGNDTELINLPNIPFKDQLDIFVKNIGNFYDHDLTDVIDYYIMNKYNALLVFYNSLSQKQYDILFPIYRERVRALKNADYNRYADAIIAYVDGNPVFVTEPPNTQLIVFKNISEANAYAKSHKGKLITYSLDEDVKKYESESQQ